MERYKCRFCFKSFINGRALGGHMRSHMLSLSAKRELYELTGEEEEEERPSQLSDDDDTESDASSSSSDEDEEQDHVNCGEFDHLKRNHRIQMVDDDELEFDFADDDDVESDTESSRVNPTRRRSKRTRKLGSFDFDFKKLKTSQPGELVTEPEHHSSASDTTTEEDLAFCLIMLSRDKWKQHTKRSVEEEEDETDHECEDYKSSKNRGGGGGRGRFVAFLGSSSVSLRGSPSLSQVCSHSQVCSLIKFVLSSILTSTPLTLKGQSKDTIPTRFNCETCGKVFKSYQALGGHRASHKKNKACTTKTEQVKTEHVNNGLTEKRSHECPICFRVFSSGQALGGHKRSHGSSIGGGLSINQVVRMDKEEEVSLKQRMIDLNLPAPTEEDETSLVFDEL